MRIASLLLAGTAIVFVPGVGIAFAQEAAGETNSAEDGGEEIIVQARKRSERLTKIPETVDALTSEQIERAGIKTLEDVGRQTPNIVLNRRQDNEPNVVIRGVGAFGNTQGVGFYIDDVQNFTDQATSVEDVERIEILKGPQGTLYGGSNIGGAIKYILKRPGEEFGATAKVGYGTFGTVESFAAVDLPVDDTFAARVSGYYNHSDGFSPNITLGNRADESDEWGIRLALEWHPSDDFTLRFTYRHNEVENGGNIYVIAATGADYSRAVDYNNDVFNKRRVDGGILTLTYDAGFAEATSITSYTRRSADLLWDIDYSSADAVTVYNGDRNSGNVFTQELRLASTGDSDLDWLVGAYYADIDNRGITNNIDLRLGPAATGGDAILIEDYGNAVTQERQYAAFATLNYRFGQVRVGGGLRLARVEYTATNRNEGTVREVNDTSVLPKLTLAYDVDDDTMLYANFAMGLEPGRVNLRVGGSPYKAEEATSFEAGIKGTAFSRALIFDVAAFYTDYRKRQFESRFVNDDGTITEEITNIGTSVSYGVEAGLTYRATPELTLAASAGYLFSEWDDADAEYYLMPIDGLRVPNAPRFQGNASIDYRIPLSSGLEVGLRADVAYSSSFYWDVPNLSKQPAYEIVNLRVSLGDPEGGWELALRGENVTDQGYFTEYTPDVFGPGLGLGAPATPARVIASISVSL